MYNYGLATKSAAIPRVRGDELCLPLPKDRRYRAAGLPLSADGTRRAPVAFLWPIPPKQFAVPDGSTTDQRQTGVKNHRQTLRKILAALPIHIHIAPTRWESPLFPVFPPGCFKVILSYRRRQIRQSW